MKKSIILSLIFFACSAYTQDNLGQRYLQRQIEQHRFEEPVWEEVTKELDYSPVKKLREQKEKKKDKQNNEQNSPTTRDKLPTEPNDRPLLNTLMKVVIILLAAVALALLLRQFLGWGIIPRNTKIKPQPILEVSLETIEENLHDTKFNQFIQEAINEGHYVLAVRLYFLAILKELSLMRLIHWKKNKTNREYLQELKNKTDYADFRKTVHIFERIWYGNRAINALEFQKIEKPFANFLQRLQEKNREAN